jgi:nitrite reductase/ring-hydroxylating ferredoxin subunit
LVAVHRQNAVPMSEADGSVSSEGSKPSPELTEVATEVQLAGTGRLLVQAGGRYLVRSPHSSTALARLTLLTHDCVCQRQALIAHGGEVHAIDATCYHMGGPLLHADIEDAGSYGPCVVCPWHRYQISLRTGDSLYQSMSGTVCSKGRKQRVHEVIRQDGKIFVRLDSEGKTESDTYAFKKPAPSGGGATPPQRRSGDVLRAGAAGLRRPPLPAGAAGDVVKSMCGADGRAPWARSSSSPPPPPPAGFKLGEQKAATGAGATAHAAPGGAGT